MLGICLTAEMLVLLAALAVHPGARVRGPARAGAVESRVVSARPPSNDVRTERGDREQTPRLVATDGGDVARIDRGRIRRHLRQGLRREK